MQGSFVCFILCIVHASHCMTLYCAVLFTDSSEALVGDPYLGTAGSVQDWQQRATGFLWYEVWPAIWCCDHQKVRVTFKNDIYGCFVCVCVVVNRFVFKLTSTQILRVSLVCLSPLFLHIACCLCVSVFFGLFLSRCFCLLVSHGRLWLCFTWL